MYKSIKPLHVNLFYDIGINFTKWNYNIFLDFIILYNFKKTIFALEDEQHTQRSGAKQNE